MEDERQAVDSHLWKTFGVIRLRGDYTKGPHAQSLRMIKSLMAVSNLYGFTILLNPASESALSWFQNVLLILCCRSRAAVGQNHRCLQADRRKAQVRGDQIGGGRRREESRFQFAQHEGLSRLRPLVPSD